MSENTEPTSYTRLDDSIDLPSPSQRVYFSLHGKGYSIDSDVLSRYAQTRLNPDVPVHQIIIGRLAADKAANGQSFGALVKACENSYVLSELDEESYQHWKRCAPDERPLPPADPERLKHISKLALDKSPLEEALRLCESAIMYRLRYEREYNQNKQGDDLGMVTIFGKDGVQPYFFSRELAAAVCQDIFSGKPIGQQVLLQRLYRDERDGTDTLGQALTQIRYRCYTPSAEDLAVIKDYHAKQVDPKHASEFGKRLGNNGYGAHLKAGAAVGAAAIGGYAATVTADPMNTVMGAAMGGAFGAFAGDVAFQRRRPDLEGIGDADRQLQLERILTSAGQMLDRYCHNSLSVA